MPNPLEELYNAGLTSPALVQQALKAKQDQDVLRAISAMRQAGLSDQQIQGLAQSQGSGSMDLAGGYDLLDPAIRMAAINSSMKLGRAGLAQTANDQAWQRTTDAATMAGHPQNIVSYLDLLSRSKQGVPLNNPIVQNITPMFPTPAGPYDDQIKSFLGDDPNAFSHGGMLMSGGPKVLMDADTGNIDATLNENGGEHLRDLPGGGVAVDPGKKKTLGKYRQRKIINQAKQQTPAYAAGTDPYADFGAYARANPKPDLANEMAKWDTYYGGTESGKAPGINHQLATLQQAIGGYSGLGGYMAARFNPWTDSSTRAVQARGDAGYGSYNYNRDFSDPAHSRVNRTLPQMSIPTPTVQPIDQMPYHDLPTASPVPLTPRSDILPVSMTPQVLGSPASQAPQDKTTNRLGSDYGVSKLAAGGGLHFSTASKAAINKTPAQKSYAGSASGGGGGGNSSDPLGWQAAYNAYHPTPAPTSAASADPMGWGAAYAAYHPNEVPAGGDYRYGSSQGTNGQVPIGAATYIRDANGNLTAVANPDPTAANTYNYVETSYHPVTGRVEPHTVTVQMTPAMQQQLGQEMASKDIAYRIGNMRGGDAGTNQDFMTKVNTYGPNMKNWPKGDVQTGASLWASGQDPTAGHYTQGMQWNQGTGRNDANYSVSTALATKSGGPNGPSRLGTAGSTPTLGQRLGSTTTPSTPASVAPSTTSTNNSQQVAAKLLAAIRNNTLLSPEFIATLEKGEVPGLGQITRQAFNSLPKTQQSALIGLWISTGQATDEAEIRDQFDKNAPASVR